MELKGSPPKPLNTTFDNNSLFSHPRLAVVVENHACSYRLR